VWASTTNPELITIVEGGTKILVPSLSLHSNVATKREPVFFNSAAELNRDISVIAYRSFLASSSTAHRDNFKNRDESTMADSLCGTGVRGLRVAVEVPEVDHVYLNDVNPLAIDVAKKSSVINHVEHKCHFSVNEACNFLLGARRRSDTHSSGTNSGLKMDRIRRRFKIVDLDPFGSPANYIDCMMRSVENGGLVSVTATDTAILCGKHPEVCLRKYYGLPLNSSYSNEIALRLLISLVGLTSSRLGISICPLFAHTNMHYIRLYAKAVLSNKLANKIFSNIGYIQHCFRCGNRTASNFQTLRETCELCQANYSTAGWLWTGRIYDKEFVREMMNKTFLFQRNGINQAHESSGKDAGEMDERSKNSQNGYTKRAANDSEKIQEKKNKFLQKLFARCISEHDDMPYYFTSDEIASKLKMGPPPLSSIIERLTHAGFRTSHSGLNHTAFKTEAKINEIVTHFKS
jgi:tRNA (guanine26-N2/guanine27-N2)-dimethyltransferase